LTGNEDAIRSSLQGEPVQESTPKASNKLRETEIQSILGALAQTRWNQRKAAKLLGISYSSLRRRIAKYDLKNRTPEQALLADDGNQQ